MTNYTVSDAVKASAGKYFGNAGLLEEQCADITTDSRKVVPGAIFAAIAGTRVDGHDFAAQAIQDGAFCAIVEKPPADSDMPHILVSSTHSALRFIAADYRERFRIPVIGVTGSVGKTSAKEMIARVLEQNLRTLCTEGNFNNELGVPLTLFRLNEEHKAAVIEMGISEFGEMTRLTRIVKPNSAVFTSIGDAHLSNLGSREGVLKAKAELLGSMPNGSVAFINGDDELLMGMKAAPRKKLSFGLGEHCDFRASEIKNLGVEGISCRISGFDRKFDVRIPAYGLHMVYAALAAASVGLYFGLSGDEIAAGIRSYKPVGHRARISDIGALTIVDDCYNANPTSVSMAISSLECFAPRRRVAILGDMLDLGENAEALHRDVGIHAAKSGAIVITCGDLARHISAGALDSGGEALHFDSREELLEALKALTSPGDAVLVKASRGMQFEDIVARLSGQI